MNFRSVKSVFAELTVNQALQNSHQRETLPCRELGKFFANRLSYVS